MRSLIIILAFACVLLSCKQKINNNNFVVTQEYKDNLVKANRGLVDVNQQKIESYVERNGWNATKTKTGLWYEIVESGGGEQAIRGKIAHLKYTLSLLDGTVCYSSDSIGEKVFKIGQGGVESGLEEAILLMKCKDKAKFIMPPYLAHGLLGDEDKIPALSIIVYHIELLNLTDKK